LPRDIAATLHTELVKVVRSPDMKERFTQMGIEPVTNSPEEFSRYIREQVTKWSAVVKASRSELE
jgi:tripartite-type tricarboxylate transporter receptor subunit TctC